MEENNKKISIDMSFLIIIVAVVCFTIILSCMVKEGTKIDTVKEQTKQLELQLQIEQEKNK